jgi:hypothetical protein
MKDSAYWRYLWKKGIPLTCVAFGFYLLLAFVLIIANNSNLAYGSDTSPYNSLTVAFVSGGYVVGLIIPLFSKAKYCSRRGSDLYLSLPYNRKKSLLFSSIFGFLQFYVPYLFSFFIAALLMVSPVDHGLLSMAIVGAIFGLGSMAMLTSYLLSIGVTSFANNLLDCFLFLIAAVGVPYLFSLSFLSISSFGIPNPAFKPGAQYYYYTNYNESLQLFVPVEGFYEYARRLYGLNGMEPATLLPFYILLLHFLLSSGIGVFGYFHFLSWKAEEAGGTSKSLFAMPFWIDAVFGLTYSACACSFFTYPSSNYLIAILYLVLAFLYLVFYFILKRKIAFSWVLLANGLGTIMAGTLLGGIVYLGSH